MFHLISISEKSSAFNLPQKEKRHNEVLGMVQTIMSQVRSQMRLSILFPLNTIIRSIMMGTPKTPLARIMASLFRNRRSSTLIKKKKFQLPLIKSQGLRRQYSPTYSMDIINVELTIERSKLQTQSITSNIDVNPQIVCRASKNSSRAELISGVEVPLESVQ